MNMPAVVKLSGKLCAIGSSSVLFNKMKWESYEVFGKLGWRVALVIWLIWPRSKKKLDNGYWPKKWIRAKPVKLCRQLKGQRKLRKISLKYGFTSRRILITREVLRRRGVVIHTPNWAKSFLLIKGQVRARGNSWKIPARLNWYWNIWLIANAFVDNFYTCSFLFFSLNITNWFSIFNSTRHTFCFIICRNKCQFCYNT